MGHDRWTRWKKSDTRRAVGDGRDEERRIVVVEIVVGLGLRPGMGVTRWVKRVEERR